MKSPPHGVYWKDIGGPSKIKAHVDGGRVAWIAKITGPHHRYEFEREFIAHTKFDGPSAGKYPVYRGEVIEVVDKKHDFRRYYKRDHDGSWTEVDEDTVKDEFGGSTPMHKDVYRCWECDEDFHLDDLVERDGRGYVCTDCHEAGDAA